ncbi:MAG: hypothetical protein AAF570_28145 [Bacteroidota bacterium]
MNTTNLPRETLNGYFITNAVPTQGQFEDLIAASLNQTDDGISKSLNTSLCVIAGTTAEKGIIWLTVSTLTGSILMGAQSLGCRITELEMLILLPD